MNPFSFLTGLLGNLISTSGTGVMGTTGTMTFTPGNITFTPAQFQALLKAAETFGPMLMGISPAQMAVVEQLLTAFGYGNLIPPTS